MLPHRPKIACHHLGLDIPNPSKPITLLGGLTSFAAQGNNYSMHVRYIYHEPFSQELKSPPKPNGQTPFFYTFT